MWAIRPHGVGGGDYRLAPHREPTMLAACDLARLRADVQVGFDEIARGEGIEYSRPSGRRLAADIKARGRAARATKG